VKKRQIILITIILFSLITLTTAGANAPPHKGTNPEVQPAQQTGIIQGNLACNGVLFFVLEKQPLTQNYEAITPTTTIRDPNLEIYAYNPTNNPRIDLVIEEFQLNSSTLLPDHIQYQNQTIQAPEYQIVKQEITISLTKQEEDINIGINGTYYSSQEIFVTIPPVPFFETGEIPFLAFVMVMSGLTIIIAFGASLLLLQRGKYFPPVKLIYILVLAGFTAIAGEGILTSDYYQIIQTRWEYYFIPLFALFLIIFLSKIPTKIQRGLLLRFMADRGNKEERTQFMTIYTSEIEMIELSGMRHSGMEYIDKRSYAGFIKRLMGIHIPIYFSQGELPSEVAKPEQLRKRLSFTLKNTFTFKNVKRDTGDFDFGYLLDQKANPEIVSIEKERMQNEIPLVETPEETTEKNKRRKRVWNRIRKYKIFRIPISGHHSRLIEEFLAGLQETELKGKRIDLLTVENAELKAQIKALTYWSTSAVIDTYGKSMENRQEKREDSEERGRNELDNQ